MRKSTLVAVALSVALAGCASMNGGDRKPVVAEPGHPAVVIQGVDGTTMAGELMNGSITVDSGQGELTLLTDHIHTVTLAADADKLDSDSMKVTGKVKDTRFFLKNEHGVFTLAKDRLKRIDFVNNLPKAGTGTMAGSASSTGTVRATAASPAR